jgi:hypothetical protein
MITLKIDGFLHDFSEEDLIETVKDVDFLQDAIRRLLGDDEEEIYGTKADYLEWLKEHFKNKTAIRDEHMDEVFNNYMKAER